MAELDFILINNEQAKLIDYLLELKAMFIPSLDYERPEFLELINREEIEKTINSLDLNGPIFLLWENISRYPLEFDSITKEGKKIYYLMQRYGGPYIDFGPCKIFVEGKDKFITSGSIGHYAKYWIEELDDNIKVSEEIKSKYKEITKFIKTMTKRVKSKSGIRYYWVGREAIKMLQNSEIRDSLDLDV